MDTKQKKIPIESKLQLTEFKPDVEKGVIKDEKRYLYEPDESFDCMCIHCDKELIIHLTKLLISGTVLLFSMGMLWSKNGDTAFYSSTISLILGTFLGTQMKKNTS